MEPLGSIGSKKTEESYTCNCCDFITFDKNDYNKHFKTKKHKNNLSEVDGSKKTEKNWKKYTCNCCDFITFDKNDFMRHNNTKKHKNNLSEVNGSRLSSQKTEKNEKNRRTYQCEICNKIYANSGGLWKHKQKCSVKLDGQNSITDTTPGNNHDVKNSIHESSITESNPDLVVMLMKELRDYKDLVTTQNNTIVELSKNIGNGGGNNTMNHSHNHTNSHNKTFNLQFFLNETCKDAMNITDFVSSLKLTLQDLEKVGELGYAEGISRVFVKGLNDLDVTKRPIHCSDLKREVIHIKDQDKWEKDDNKERLTKAIKDVSTKNLMLMSDWQKENPGCTEYNHGKNDTYLKIMSNSVGPLDEQGEKKDINRIMRTVAKTTIIDRENT